MRKLKKIVTIGLATAMVLGMTLTASAAVNNQPCPVCREYKLAVSQSGTCRMLGCKNVTYKYTCTKDNITYYYCLANHLQ